MLLNFCIFFMASCFVSTVTSLREDLNIPYKSHCYSCATFAYLQIWDNLMHHYFPPKNFTDRCWQPDNAIGTVPCSSACFTIVERIDQHDYIEHNEYSGVMRGCVDRLLLFGLDDDVTNILTPSIDREDFCRQTDRKLLRLYPLSDESELVTLCTCVGDHCNDIDMLKSMSSSKIVFISSLLISLFSIL